MNGLIGRKLGMTRLFAEDGVVTPVTVIEAGPCRVTQLKDDAVQLGFGSKKLTRTSKAELGHAKKAGLDTAPRVLREFPLDDAAPEIGAEVKVDIFEAGEMVKVTGTTKGRGFQGVVHRYGFAGGPASHGSTRFRRTGSIGPGTNPSRVIKGKKMPGHMGDLRVTTQNIRVAAVRPDDNVVVVHGSVPGCKNGNVILRLAIKKHPEA